MSDLTSITSGVSNSTTAAFNAMLTITTAMQTEKDPGKLAALGLQAQTQEQLMSALNNAQQAIMGATKDMIKKKEPDQI
jgi:hypothetical protein